MTTDKGPRLLGLDGLRGVAALLVCWHHLTSPRDFLPDGIVRTSGAHGDLGVQMFFVISGFVIPFALVRADYSIRDYGRFIVKRLVRLEPPYIVSLLLTLAIGFLSVRVPGYRGEPFHPTVPQVLLHLGYLNVFSQYPWLNGVYWTLAIELQYYLVVGLFFGLIASHERVHRNLVFVVFGGAAFVLSDWHFLPHWLFHFMLGMTVFQYRSALIHKTELAVWLTFAAAGAVATDGPMGGGAALLAAVVLAFVRVTPPRPILWLGSVSYSLYLTHLIVGPRTENLLVRVTGPGHLTYVVLGVALTACLFSAWLMYWFVERPAQRWAGAIRYKRLVQLEAPPQTVTEPELGTTVAG